MIVHRHPDGSEGYEYQLGDIVVIKDVITGGAWFKRVIGRTGEIVAFDGRRDRRGHWSISAVDVRYSSDWGPARRRPWQVTPTPATRAAATVLMAETGDRP